MSSIRDLVAQADDIDSETVKVEEWGVTVQLRSCSVEERGHLYSLFTDENAQKDLAGAYAAWLIASCYDPETGERAFSDDDAAMLRQKSGAVVEELVKKSMRLAGVDPEAVDRGKGGS